MFNSGDIVTFEQGTNKHLGKIINLDFSDFYTIQECDINYNTEGLPQWRLHKSRITLLYSIFDPAHPLPKLKGGESYYNQGIIEVKDFIKDHNLDFFEGNVIKYITRYRFKYDDKEKQLEDLKKAKRYIEYLIEFKEKEINVF